MICSCASEQVADRPKHLIPEDTFVKAYADVHVLEASIKQKLVNGHDSPEELAAYYYHVLQQHGINQTAFDSTRNWYARNPEAMKVMVGLAMDRIAEMQADTGLTPPVETQNPDGVETESLVKKSVESLK